MLLGRTPHLRALGVEGAADIAAAQRAIDTLDLAAFVDRPVTTLSGGERQRVIVARLLAQDAPIALLDEPTTALDVGHQQQVLDLVDSLRAEHELTVVATMHDLTLAAQYADRMILLDDGQVAADGAPADVLTEESIARHYDAHIRVVRVDDRLAVVPARPER